MSVLLSQLGWLAALAATAWAAGWLVWARRDARLLLHPLPVCVGLALVGQGALVLAAIGELRPLPVLGAIVAVHLGALPGWRRAVATAWRLSAMARGRALAWSTLALLAIAPGFVIGLYPPHAFDETVYHLPFARELATSGSLPYLPELRTPVFPILGEALQSILLPLGDEASHVVALLATLLTAALVLAWGREAAGLEAGWIAAGLYLGSPLVSYLAGTGYVDAPLAALSTAALYAAWRSSREGGGWAAAAGLLAGSAAAVKYLGLFSVAIAALALLRGGRVARRLSLFLVAATPALLPTYLWIWSQTGNPLHPFYPEVFGSTVWVSVAPPAPSVIERAGAALSLPFDAVLRRELVGGQPPLTPAYLLGLPLLAWYALGSRRGRRPVALLAVAMASFLVVPPEVRYLLPWLPAWAVLLGIAAAAAAARFVTPARQRAAAALLALGLMLPGVAYGAFYGARAGAPPTNPAARREFLERQVPGYRPLAWLADRGGRTAVVYTLQGERLHGIAQQRILGEHSGPHAFRRLAPLLADPDALGRELRAAGATHLLVPSAVATHLQQRTGPLRAVYSDGEFSLFELGAARGSTAAPRAGPAPRAASAGGPRW